MAKAKLISTTQKAVHGDCERSLPNLVPRGAADLIVMDSPYNLGRKYHNYDDDRPHPEFIKKVLAWMNCIVDALHEHGSLWVFAPDEWVADAVTTGNLLGLYRRSWIVWTYTFGVANQKNFSRSHTHILYFTKHRKKFTFNADAIRVPSARQLVYNDKRQNPKGKLPDNTWALLREHLEPYMTPDTDTWLQSRICGTFKERQKHMDNQIPLPMWERIILACSNPGDLVVDPFAGSFGSGEVCVKINRNYLGIDISKPYVQAGSVRLKAAKKHI